MGTLAGLACMYTYVRIFMFFFFFFDRSSGSREGEDPMELSPPPKHNAGPNTVQGEYPAMTKHVHRSMYISQCIMYIGNLYYYTCNCLSH